MALFGNICLGLAAFLYIAPLQLILSSANKRDEGGLVWGAIFVLVPLWLLLTTSLCAATSKGAFDWLFKTRAPQYWLLLAAAAAMLVVSGFSLLGKFEPASQIPVSARPLTGWAVQAIPLSAMAFALFALNPNLAAPVSAPAYRLPMLILSAASLLSGCGMLIEWMASAQKRQAEQFEEIAERYSQYDRDTIARLETLNATEHFAELIGQTGIYEEPPIRKLALEKAQQSPDFTAALVDALTKSAPTNSFVYLEASEPPDRKALAEPVRSAILDLARRVRAQIATGNHLYDDLCESDARRILVVVNKFSDQGVDYLPAVREYRAAFDEPRSQTITFKAVARLDAWIAKRLHSANSTPANEDLDYERTADISERFTLWIRAVAKLRVESGGDFIPELRSIVELSRVRSDSPAIRDDVRRVAVSCLHEWASVAPLPGDPKPN